jgi:type I pantothenate kinase
MHRYANLSVEETIEAAERIWGEIDHPNLKEYIEPTKSRARLILEKGSDHSIRSVLLRKV